LTTRNKRSSTAWTACRQSSSWSGCLPRRRNTRKRSSCNGILPSMRCRNGAGMTMKHRCITGIKHLSARCAASLSERCAANHSRPTIYLCDTIAALQSERAPANPRGGEGRTRAPYPSHITYALSRVSSFLVLVFLSGGGCVSGLFRALKFYSVSIQGGFVEN
jgi:hypothetical protein